MTFSGIILACAELNAASSTLLAELSNRRWADRKVMFDRNSRRLKVRPLLSC
jgi:hypothetical protein